MMTAKKALKNLLASARANRKLTALAVLAVLVAISFLLPPEFAKNVPFNVVRTALMLGLIVLAFVMAPHELFANFSSSVKRAPRLAQIAFFALPAVVFAVVAVEFLAPDFAVWLVRCEERPACGLNFRHAIFLKSALEFAAAIVFASILPLLIRKRARGLAIMVGAITLVLLFMAGEELSWGQRIFSFATPEKVKNLNAQNEFNLHDMATQTFQNAWYFAGWALLVAAPFFREAITRFLAKSKRFSRLVLFVPPEYFALIFAAAFGLVDPIKAGNGLKFSSILFATLGTAAILCYAVFRARGRLANQICLALSVFVIALFFSLFVSGVGDLNAGAPMEYLESFLALGFLAWAVVSRQNLRQKFAPRRR